jgi:Domain of unknown function (DUF4386)
MDVSRNAIRTVGFLFLAAFATYGTGSWLIEAMVSATDVLAEVAAHTTRFEAGALLMLANSVVVVAIGVLLAPVLAGFSRSVALGYLAARIAEGILLGTGILTLFLLVSMSQQPAPDPSLAMLASEANAYAYQFAMIGLGVGSLPMCVLLYRASLVPRGLAACGVVGYAALQAGAILELFGVGVGLMLSIPGGVFEVALGFWLIARGFAAPMREPERDAVGNLVRAYSGTPASWRS